jgi:hypothetical protein
MYIYGILLLWMICHDDLEPWRWVQLWMKKYVIEPAFNFLFYIPRYHHALHI